MTAMNKSLHLLCSYSSCHVMLVLHQIYAHVMLLCFSLMIRTTCYYAHEPNQNFDQVPPNRALFVQPQLPYGKALMRYTGGLLLRACTKVGRLRVAVTLIRWRR